MPEIIIQDIDIRRLELNSGQLYGLPANPRILRDERFLALKQSIQDEPEMLSLREILVYPLSDVKGHEDNFIIIGGNMRFRACKELGYKKLPCKIIPLETPVKKLRAYTIKDNSSFGDWDYEILNDWEITELQDFGAELSFDSIASQEDTWEDSQNENEEDTGYVKESSSEREQEQESEDKDDSYEYGSYFADNMYKDVLYPSNNDFEIPTLLLEMQAGKL